MIQDREYGMSRIYMIQDMQCLKDILDTGSGVLDIEDTHTIRLTRIFRSHG